MHEEVCSTVSTKMHVFSFKWVISIYGGRNGKEEFMKQVKIDNYVL